MKIDLVFLIVLGIVVAYVFALYKIETMADVGSLDQIKEAVKQVYLADVEAIRNLSEVATKLQTSGLTIPGQIKVADKISTNGLDPINMPDGWTGGLRIFDGYASGTMGFGPDGKKLNATINADGNIVVNTGNVNSNLNVGGDLKIGKWIISDRGDGLGFYFGDKNNLKYFMWPNGTNLWQSNNQLQSAGNYQPAGDYVRTDRRYEIYDNSAGGTEHCLDAASHGQRCDKTNAWRKFGFRDIT